ncbi:PQQ-binding-like beta-propeller repeat protein [Streptomyces sp. NPDC050428]|uniref:serine/threonine-protein kinase n=1 Tax=Streptomyces sp. NPDC050428 TaxID=3155757 RepID=UPI0034143BD3
MLSPLTHDDPAGLAGFRLLARLGHGGMGTVYLARSAGGRTVALKTMHPSIATDPASRTRFRLETDAARVIGGHHGASVVDADPLAPTPWLATEYVLGPPLDDAIDLCGPLPEVSVRALGAALAGALAQLHASDVVHRDLKPSNVMVTAYGPKIIDFGIARASGDDHLTRAGAAAGTPAFMSPEQAIGQEHTPTGDVFALAGVLLYAATGHGPFGTGQAADLLYRVRYADPDLTGLPQALIPILGACLAKDPDRRPTTHDLAGQLHSGQGHFADHLPDALLADIARRASEVWQHRPERLPVPSDHATAETVPVTTAPGLSRRKLFTISGGALLATTGIGAGVWASTRERNSDTSESTGSGKAPAALWRRSIATASPAELGRPLVVGDKLIVTTRDGMSAVEASSGRSLWSENQVLSSWDVATDGENLFAVDYSLSPREGLRIAQIDLDDGALMDPAVTEKAYNGKLVGNQLLCVSGDAAWLLTARVRKEDTDESSGIGPERGWLIASFSLSTGKKLTELILDEPVPEDYPWVTGVRAVGSSLVLFFRTESGGVDVLVCDTRTGTGVWRAPLDLNADDAARSPVAVDGKHLYTSSDAVRARRTTDGEEAWSYQGADVTGYGPPTVKDGVVYVVEAAGEAGAAGARGLVAISADTGALLWREKNPVSSGHELKVAPSVGDKYIYKHSAAGLRAIDLRTHETAWLHPEPLDRFTALMTAGLLIGVGEGPMVALPLEPSDHASS